MATDTKRRPFVGGNWKCNGTRASVADLVSMLNDLTPTHQADVVVAPTSLHLDFVNSNLRSDYQTCAQNIYVEKSGGAFTGEICADMLLDMNVKWVILGHSERRHILGESNEFIGRKVTTAINSGLNVIACVGETLEERDSDRAMDVVIDQLEVIYDCLDLESKEAHPEIIIAYEPVWAIGTGRTATLEQAQEIHSAIRTWIDTRYGHTLAQTTRIIYGGSVKSTNAMELIISPDIDGFLVGGASLTSEFGEILRHVNSSASPEGKLDKTDKEYNAIDLTTQSNGDFLKPSRKRQKLVKNK